MPSLLYKNIKLKSLSINEHTINAFNSRNYNNKPFVFDDTIEIEIIIQREIKGKKITALKGLVRLNDNAFALVNLYENNISKELFAKTLTILTAKQLKLSRNLHFGNKLNFSYQTQKPEILNRDKWFDNDYTDYLKSIVWTEDDVVHPNNNNDEYKYL